MLRLWAALMCISTHLAYAPEIKPWLRHPAALYGIELLLLLAGAWVYQYPLQAARLANWLESLI